MERVNDALGQPIEERFYGTEGQPVATLDGGYHQRINKYDKVGNLVEQSYFDVEGKPIEDRINGVHRYVRVFDRFRYPVLTQYYDAYRPARRQQAGLSQSRIDLRRLRLGTRKPLVRQGRAACPGAGWCPRSPQDL